MCLNIFECTSLSSLGIEEQGKLFSFLLSSIATTLYFARMASGNGKWRMLGFVYIIIVLSYAFLRMLY